MGRAPAPMTADYAEAIRSRQARAAVEDGRTAGCAVLVARPGYLLLDNVAVLSEIGLYTGGGGIAGTLAEEVIVVVTTSPGRRQMRILAGRWLADQDRGCCGQPLARSSTRRPAMASNWAGNFSLE